MPRDSDLVRIRHMLEAAREAQGFAAGRTREDIHRDRMLDRAIWKAIEIIGEAATHVADETRRELPAIPWGDVIGMRNRLIHTYFEINRDIVWDTVEIDLPPLVAALEEWLAKQGD
jgi:uncharacterized protein with HEPN domain